MTKNPPKDPGKQQKKQHPPSDNVHNQFDKNKSRSDRPPPDLDRNEGQERWQRNPDKE